MKLTNYCILALLCIAFSAKTAAQETFIAADNKNIEYVGRVNHANPKSPVMAYPGTSIKANFRGSYIKMKAKPGSRYFVAKIDNLSPRKIDFGSNDSVITLADGLTAGSHRVELMLAYEGYDTRPEFRGFLLDKGGKLLPQSEKKARRIEFIGNSITCGFGNEATDGKQPFSIDTENHYITYAAITARALNADEMVVARSGIGAYRNYNGNPQGDKDIMPRWYDYTLLYDSTQVWNHNAYKPQLICVNLGTNDLSTKGYNLALFKESYKRFILHLRAIHPQAAIVMLTGCMLHGKPLQDQLTAISEILDEMKANGDSRIYHFDFPPQDGSLGYGAGYHPSRAQHQKMSRELVPFIKTIMNW